MKLTIFLVLIGLLLSACGTTGNTQGTTPPATNIVVSPPVEVIPAISPTPEIPKIDVDGIKIPDPKVSNPEFFDVNSSSINQFIRAMSEAGINIKPKDIADSLSKNYQVAKSFDGKIFIRDSYIVTDQNGTPYMIGLIGEQGANEEWLWQQDNPSLEAHLTGKDIVIRLGNVEPTALLATKIKMEVNGDAYSIYNKDFDWTKITDNWDEVKAQLQAGNIPFQDKVFNQNNVAKAQAQIKFANSHNLVFVGDALFYPSILKDPMLKNLNADQKKKVLIFTAMAKIIKFPEIKEIDLVSELAAFLQWQPEIKSAFDEIGGVNFIHDLAALVKQINPKIQLIATEDMIINDQKSDALQSHYDSFFALLQQLKQNGTPLDKVKFENSIWVNAPPTAMSISESLKKVQDLGFGIAGSDTVIATGDKNPIWANWPPTIKPVKSNEVTERQAQILYLLCKTYFSNGANEIGFSSPENPDWMGTQGNIFTENGQPTLEYFALLEALSN